jgi:alginate O-acetyltransferase complex protein AlgI
MELSLLDLKFVLVLSAVALGRRFCPRRYDPAFGLAASAALVGIASLRTLAVISCLTLFYLYPVLILYRRVRCMEPRPRFYRWLLPASIAGLVILLVFFKTYRYFTVPFLAGIGPADRVLAIVGFSYFILRAIAFLHIQSILDIEERTPWSLLYFMLFPPTITSGPIQKYQDFREQVKSSLPLTRPLLYESVYRITRGFFRKAVLAYVLDTFVRNLLGLPALSAYSSVALIGCLYLYFYYDFAGYSDIAIGFGALMGIRVPENFRKPLTATSVTEFWRHWHITLVDWFRDNVYLPLGGMRSGRTRAAVLGFIIMALCGLWHGFTAAFIAWGCWHGLLLASEAMSGSKPMLPSQRHGARYWSKVAWTNARVAVGAVFFLPDPNSIATVFHGFTRWY